MLYFVNPKRRQKRMAKRRRKARRRRRATPAQLRALAKARRAKKRKKTARRRVGRKGARRRVSRAASRRSSRKRTASRRRKPVAAKRRRRRARSRRRKGSRRKSIRLTPVRGAIYRKNPRRGRFNIRSAMRSFQQGVMDAAGVVAGKAATRVVANFLPLPGKDTMFGNLATQSVSAILVGLVAQNFVGANTARMMVAGGISAPLETALKGVPVIGGFLGDDYLELGAGLPIGEYVEPMGEELPIGEYVEY